MKSKGALIFSIGLAFFSIIILNIYISKERADIYKNSKLIEVYIAKEDIPELVRIESDMVEKRQVPEIYKQPYAVTNIDELIGNVTLVPILKDEQVLSTKLISFGLDTGLAMKIPPDKRGLTIGVDDVTGVAGLIVPGNKVDIYATFKLQKKEARSQSQYFETYLLFSKVEVLAIEKRLGRVEISKVQTKEERERFNQSDSNVKAAMKEFPKNVTVAVYPSQAISIITAQQAGLITLTLRPQFGAKDIEKLNPFNTYDIIGVNKETVNQRIPTYQEIRGNEVSY